MQFTSNGSTMPITAAGLRAVQQQNHQTGPELKGWQKRRVCSCVQALAWTTLKLELKGSIAL
jgi:hypothetical protein